MDSSRTDLPKMPDMVMCGDHSSITKTELNAKEPKLGKEKLDAKEKEKDEKVGWLKSHTRLSPTASHTERPSEQRGHTVSEHTMKMLEKRRAQSLEITQRTELDISASGNRALVQAALGSFRWPPYLLAVWVLVLVLTHALHCLVAVLERALPALRKLCHYFRAWTEESWKSDSDVSRACPLALGTATGAAYGLYFLLCGAHAIAVWAIEPLSGPDEKNDQAHLASYTYADDVNSNTNL